MEWDGTLNRCVGKRAARETRHDAQNCNTLTDIKAREQCHIGVAEKKTGLSSDTGSLNQGNTTASMVMNGVGLAYSIIQLISAIGGKGASSMCTSKKIFGVTSLAGVASDIYLKRRAKKKVQELEGKYKLDKNSNAHEAQVKALEYLKEEQETVASIANMEKKRNLLLMAGYGIAAGFAAYEIFADPPNPDCYKPDGEAAKDAKPAEVADAGEVTEVSANASPAPGTISEVSSSTKTVTDAQGVTTVIKTDVVTTITPPPSVVATPVPVTASGAGGGFSLPDFP